MSGLEFEPDEATEASLIQMVQRAETPFSPDTFQALQNFGYSQADAAIEIARGHEAGPGRIGKLQRDRDVLGAVKTDQELKNAVSNVIADWGQSFDEFGVDIKNTGDLYHVLRGIVTPLGGSLILPSMDNKGALDDLGAAIESGKEGFEAAGKAAAKAAGDLVSPVGNAVKGLLDQLMEMLKSIGIGAGVAIGIAVIGGVAYLYITRKR